MSISELQQWVREDWEKGSRQQPDVEMQLLYILEELGEVAEAIRKSKGAKDRMRSDVDLGAELADLVISVTTLANHFDIDLEYEINAFKQRLAARHEAGY
jgi:NTP pyrophosphatase (non-canonical NTP hydrolase)